MNAIQFSEMFLSLPERESTLALHAFLGAVSWMATESTEPITKERLQDAAKRSIESAKMFTT